MRERDPLKGPSPPEAINPSHPLKKQTYQNYFQLSPFPDSVVIVLNCFTFLLELSKLREGRGLREMPKVQPMTPSNPNENNRVFYKHAIKVFVSFSWLCFGTSLSSVCDG